MRLSDLAVHAGTELAEVVRDCEVETAELCADIRGTAVLTFLEKEKFIPCLEHPGIAAVICTRELADTLPAHIPGLLVPDAPKFAFYSLYNFLAQAAPHSRVPTRIGEGADIAPTAYVAPYNVEIGKNSVIGPGAVIQERWGASTAFLRPATVTVPLHCGIRAASSSGIMWSCVETAPLPGVCSLEILPAWPMV